MIISLPKKLVAVYITPKATINDRGRRREAPCLDADADRPTAPDRPPQARFTSRARYRHKYRHFDALSCYAMGSSETTKNPRSL